MTPKRHFGRRWLTALVLALTAIVIGAVFGSFRTSDAAITVKPTNQTQPTIAGTAQVGQTLTAGNGTWAGTTPITFTYQWERCDTNGKNCAQIANAMDNTYTVAQADVGSTLVISVVGKNSDGQDSGGLAPARPRSLRTGSGNRLPERHSARCRSPTSDLAGAPADRYRKRPRRIRSPARPPRSSSTS